MERNLRFTDRRMFNRVMCDEGVCRDVLEAILGIEVGKVEYLNAEQAMEPTLSGKGVRMDVFARDGRRMYDIEMQLAQEPALGQRMRYYQAALDATELGAGEDYEALLESYIIFVCAEDHYGGELPVRTFDRVCLEDPATTAGDGSRWVVLDAGGWEGAPGGALRDFLRYVRTGEADGTISREIDSRVREYNRDREWVTRVLTFEQDAQIRCNRARKEGMEAGMKEGMKEGMALMKRLLEEGRIDDATRAASDSEYRNQLLAELGM